MMLLSMSTFISVMFLQMNHPLSMGMMLMIQTMLISLISGIISQSFWFSYILFLIFIGGMLILFIYITSLASNEMFLFSSKMLIKSMITTLMMVILLKSFYFIYYNQDTSNLMFINNPLMYSLNKLYNQYTNIITILLASYLFLTLIVVVKITNIFKGPLRQMN
uniref:NADH-ubiquinone oxidoreductase chain 6 n=1 Tax=Carbrunneria paramaxi TaxID=2093489 RepID=A0A2P1H9A5_9NEOP|nr:NADH dehydrogenase subunit 6 [Carbrunneria paramaxi]